MWAFLLSVGHAGAPDIPQQHIIFEDSGGDFKWWIAAVAVPIAITVVGWIINRHRKKKD